MLVLHLGERPFRRGQDSATLASRGVRVQRVATEEEAIAHARAYDYDAFLLDLDAVDGGDIDVIALFRKSGSKLAILALTTRNEPELRVRALDLGADDVLTALCDIDEMLARLRAVVRRSGGHVRSAVRVGALEFHLERRELRANGNPVRLTPKEYELLELLVLKNGRPVSKASCLDHLYCGLEERDAKTVDVLICRVRKKLAAVGVPRVIENIWGRGFRIQMDGATTGEEAASAVAAAA